MTFAELTRGLEADRLRHGGSWRNPALWAVGVHRFGTWVSGMPKAPTRTILSKAYGLMFFGVELTTGIVLNREARIGEEFVLLRSGNVKVHPRSVIGARVRMGHDVTLGTNMDRAGAPVIGDDVTIGSGSKILGPITIGSDATIMPNTLVLSDVPAGATVIGVPGRVTKIKPPAERRSGTSVGSGGLDPSPSAA